MGKFQNTGLPDWDWWGKLWPAPSETLRELGISSGTTVAEVGCGNGYFALPAARITAPEPVYALELDETLADELTSLADLQDVENVEPIVGDARSLARHLPETVDFVLLANVFHGVGNTAGLVEQAFDSLDSGGRFAVVNWHDMPREATTVAGSPRGPPTDLRMTPEETESAVLEAADFTLQRQVELPPYHYALLFER
ncbi:class I SAM-dependent methyltransferase [Halorussus halophilus]|uniref:class I SAM-dependent methyltransferase n=1 Tax=Halorussus halophilus TaxID=2650975 RepID=UPI0013016136|nr:class I SAM-dependent methyltransferase [Halorussus halophilus]